MGPSNNGPSPLCRCRVLYIGSAVPTVTKDGLQGIQQPLRERYPTETESSDAKGIDSWLSVWYNGLLLEYVEGEKRTENAFFPVNTLHYCAAVRYVNMGGFAVEGGGDRFIPLDSPFALSSDSPHPPIFAAIFRRTTGVKVLECHGFVCTNEKAANALVRCCFHAYADTMYLKLDENMMGALNAPGGGSPVRAIKEKSSRSGTPSSELNLSEHENNGGPLMEGTSEWNERAIGQKTWQRRQQSGEYDMNSLSSSFANKKGGVVQGRPGLHEHGAAGIIVPYYQGHENRHPGFGRRTASHSELHSSAGHELFDSPRRLPPHGGPYMFGPPFPPPPPFSHHHHPAIGGHSPVAFMRPPPGAPPIHLPFPPPLPPGPHHFFPHRPMPFLPPPPAGPSPHFGRIVHFPHAPPHHPFIMRPPFFMIPPPFGPQRPPPPKSPERTGTGPIITETYDTFPRHNRATYEEPIYMPSSNNPIPPHASYKPGSFSPEIYEHYYETYKQHRNPAERKNVSGSNSDASGDYWEGEGGGGRNGFDSHVFRKARTNERAFANTLAHDGKHQQQHGNMTPKGNGSPNGGKRRGAAADDANNDNTLTTKAGVNGQPGTSYNGRGGGGEGGSGTSKMANRGQPRPETPPADYEMTEKHAAGGGHRMAAY